VDAVHDGAAELRGDDAHHLARVLRAEPGQQYEISDGQSVYLAEISESRSNRVIFRVVEPIASPELPVHITLLPALVKFERLEWAVEKATELGVERIVPVQAARSDKGLFEASFKRAERWRRIARESSQQCRRVRVPEIAAAKPLREALMEPAEFRYFFDETGGPPLLRALPDRRTPACHVALLVGPEGGWTDEERAQASSGWLAVSLGPQIVRAETAATAAVAIVINAWCVQT
jgi:16S rRNA (uracil1498-N3)-methyltransferase